MKFFKYLSYVLRHKLYVFQECCRQGLYWRGFVHDMSKLLPSEFIPYMNYFYGDAPPKGMGKNGYKKPADTGNAAFEHAWLIHQKRNPHHWQYWVLPMDRGELKVLAMPRVFAIEMVCDWRGAGKAQGKTGAMAVVDWYAENRAKIVLHPGTRAFVEHLLGYKS